MDTVFCIVLSYIVIRMWWKSGHSENDGRNTVKNRFRKRKQRRLTDEEFISVIFPTINNDK